MTTPSSPSPTDLSAAARFADVKTKLGGRIRMLRESNRLTQRSVAALAQIHWRYWQKIETGVVSPSLATIVKIAAALETSLAKLFAFD